MLQKVVFISVSFVKVIRASMCYKFYCRVFNDKKKLAFKLIKKEVTTLEKLKTYFI